ncbi:hypothetical protein NCER_101475 [Vairimorpha ceranae BRL01]|uniref:Uncharacterized protein n=2 Tax=Vairimorpha ceranae TaxID=40302 RepID=C4VA39_VAIC1|nr:hypothetical protein AAJ76_630008779 [Vairimorpha ceranae]EEQ81915.1 hypothetical protein NCER_101475 [Vairimorpha ceranae BRL01]KAF5139593.1 hypothetical protein G9O61_00g022500 [Vairimorpha ceranae]KKO74521.1 hypothetical protein AAJ76_630008779 [Vairimorpha ceranae]
MIILHISFLLAVEISEKGFIYSVGMKKFLSLDGDHIRILPKHEMPEVFDIEKRGGDESYKLKIRPYPHQGDQVIDKDWWTNNHRLILHDPTEWQSEKFTFALLPENMIKIVVKEKCVEAEDEGYVRARSCKDNDKQLYRWIPFKDRFVVEEFVERHGGVVRGWRGHKKPHGYDIGDDLYYPPRFRPIRPPRHDEDSSFVPPYKPPRYPSGHPYHPSNQPGHPLYSPDCDLANPSYDSLINDPSFGRPPYHSNDLSLGRPSFHPNDPLFGGSSYNPNYPSFGGPSYNPNYPSFGRPPYHPNDSSFGRPPQGSYINDPNFGKPPHFKESNYPSFGRPSYHPNDPSFGRPSYHPNDPSFGRPSYHPNDPSFGRPSYYPNDPSSGRPSFDQCSEFPGQYPSNSPFYPSQPSHPGIWGHEDPNFNSIQNYPHGLIPESNDPCDGCDPMRRTKDYRGNLSGSRDNTGCDELVDNIEKVICDINSLNFSM